MDVAVRGGCTACGILVAHEGEGTRARAVKDGDGEGELCGTRKTFSISILLSFCWRRHSGPQSLVCTVGDGVCRDCRQRRCLYLYSIYNGIMA